MNRFHIFTFIFFFLLSGCYFDEGLNETDIYGYVIISPEMGYEIDDLGIIYIGVYSGWNESLGYPHPNTGPSLTSGVLGDAMPYGGTSIGTFGFEDISTKCQIVEREADSLIIDENGFIIGDFVIYKTPVVEEAIIYAFIDNDNTTCNPDDGYYHYGEDGGSGYYEGTNYPDVLNYPDKYISAGDIITGEPEVVLYDSTNIVHLNMLIE